MRRGFVAEFLCLVGILALAVSFAIGCATPAMAAKKFYSVDGFTMIVLDLPTVASVTAPVSMTGVVAFENGNNRSIGIDPFDYSGNLSGVSPFFVIAAGGSLTFASKYPVYRFGLLWGSLDTFNNISFYDNGGVLLGTVYGVDVHKALGVGVNYHQLHILIESPVLFSSVVLTTSECCFEVGNAHLR